MDLFVFARKILIDGRLQILLNLVHLPDGVGEHRTETAASLGDRAGRREVGRGMPEDGWMLSAMTCSLSHAIDGVIDHVLDRRLAATARPGIALLGALYKLIYSN